MNNKELSALIRLLDDDDSYVFSAVRKKLLESDEKIIPELKTAISFSKDNLFIDRALSIINQLRFRKLDDEFKIWLKTDNSNLLYGSYLVAKYQYPELNYEDIEDQITKIINDIRSEINFKSFTGLQQIRKINHLLYSVQRFNGDFNNIINPDNSYINKVLERKKTNDVSIGIIYLFIAEKLGLPVYGVDFPGNFLLVFTDEKNSDALFYINPLNKGAIVTKKDIESFLKVQKLKHGDRYFKACSNSVVIKRLLKFLTHSYIKKNDVESLNEIQRILNLFK